MTGRVTTIGDEALLRVGMGERKPTSEAEERSGRSAGRARTAAAGQGAPSRKAAARPGRGGESGTGLAFGVGGYADLSPTARRLLEGARRLLERSGYNSLSVEAIGREAGESKGLIRYHFGGKDGLLLALVDWLMSDTMWRVHRQLRVLSAEEDRLGLVIGTSEGMLNDVQSYRLFFDLLPHLLENPAMKAQLAELFHAYRELNSKALQGDSSADVPDVVRDLAAMTMALTDGLAAQVLTEPGSVEVHRVLALWRAIVEGVLAGQLGELPGAGDAAAETPA